jgi:hypothetical protein
VDAEVTAADVPAVTYAVDTEEDGELGGDAMEMWLEALIAAESTSEPVVCRVAEINSDDDVLGRVRSRSDLTPLFATTSRSIATQGECPLLL